MSFYHVDFRSDFKVTVDVSETGHILTASRQLFTTQFTNSKVEFSRRQVNEVAHTLAGVGTLSASPIIYYMYFDVLKNLLRMKCYKNPSLKKE